MATVAQLTGEEASLQRIDPAEQPIRDLQSGASLGTVSLTPTVTGLLPVEALASGFGETGYGMVLDRSRERVLYHPSRAMHGIAIASLVAAGTWKVSPTTLGRTSGTFRYYAGDTLRLASFQSVVSPPWIVVVSGAVNEFSGPFTAVRRWTLLLFVLVRWLPPRPSASSCANDSFLEELTTATAVVGRGDFAPTPAARPRRGRKLTASFETMVSKVREMVSQIESSRQMAVLASSPRPYRTRSGIHLLSIKLNLQKIERADRTRDVAHRAGRPLKSRSVRSHDSTPSCVYARPRPNTLGATDDVFVARPRRRDARGRGRAGEGVQVERSFISDDDLVDVDPSQ
jgi:hypothetical protein